MPCMSLFDITGIQDYIFSSKKVKENVGASLLVRDVMKKVLLKAFADSPSAVTDWEAKTEFGFPKKNGTPAEVVYIGGGNAMVVFDCRDRAIDITQKISREILAMTAGGLGLAVSHVDTEYDDFKRDVRAIRKAVEQRKACPAYNKPLAGLAVTREGTTDGLPAVERSDGDYISEVAYLKRRAEKENRAAFSPLAPSGSTLPAEFDKLGRGKEGGESHIAVVHIDGNSIGKIIDDYILSTSCYNESIKRLRTISTIINEAFEEGFRALIQNLAGALADDSSFRDRFNLDAGTLPVRPLILSGDDLTFVCDGRIGIALAVEFLRALQNREISDRSQRFSACAGVAVVKPHFPFHRAYHLAEALCQSAKHRAKALGNETDPSSWLDFHIVHSGLPIDLDTTRKSMYSISGMNVVPDICGNQYTSKRYHLIARPYQVSGKSIQRRFSWEDQLSRVYHLQKWPRSRAKGLRESLFTSKQAATEYLAECESRGLFLSDSRLFDGDLTHWLDAIELADFHIDMPSMEDEGGEAK